MWSGPTLPLSWLCMVPPTPAPAPVTPASAHGAARVALLQWNVHWENQNIVGLASIIVESDPDIIGLCELTASGQSMAEALTAAAGSRTFQHQPRNETWVGYGTDIFYDSDKWAAVEGGVEPAPCAASKGGPRAANWVVLEHRSTGKKLITGGTHTSDCASGCDALHACELGHLYRQFQAMKTKYSDAPVVWMGDLNRNLSTTIMQDLLQGQVGSNTTFRVEDLGGTQSNTYYMGGPAIDFILGEAGAFQRQSGGRTSEGSKGEHLMGSDHFPIYAEVQWPAASASK